MAGRSSNFPGKYYRNTSSAAGESEGSGSSGRIDAQFTASDDSSGPTGKYISLNSEKGSLFFVPSEVLRVHTMRLSERKALIHRLKLELEKIRMVQKKIDIQSTSTVALSSSSDILSCSNGRPRPEVVKKSSASTSRREKKVNSIGRKVQPLKQSTSGKIVAAKVATAPTNPDVDLMNQCEYLLKRLMSHRNGWIFNKPVDVKGLKIPDYFTIIKHPMDLGTVKRKLTSGAYSSPLEFAADVRLTFSNAMTYNPPDNGVHIMADVLRKFFEVRWETIEKNLAVSDSKSLPAQSGSATQTEPAKPVAPSKETETTRALPPAKKRKTSSNQYEDVPEPVKPVMSSMEKHNLGLQLENLTPELPGQIIEFLRENSANGQEYGEEEIEIDIEDLSDDTLFTLRKLIDEYLQEKQKSQTKDEQCEIEILNESGFSNSSMQPNKVNGDEDVDIGGNEPPVSSNPTVDNEKDAGKRTNIGTREDRSSDSDLSSSSDSGSDHSKPYSPRNAQETQKIVDSEVQKGEQLSPGPLDVKQPSTGSDQLDQTSLEKPRPLESDNCADGESAPNERQVLPGKPYRAALLIGRFADTILKAQEKTLSQAEKGDPEKLRQEREELEMQRRKEKARLLAEAKAAEDAQKQLEAEALAEAKRKRDLEREAARQAILEMERTVEINENSRFIEDLEMLSTVPVEQLPSSADETSPDSNSLDRLDSFKYGSSKALEQFGLFMKADDEEEEPEPPTLSNAGNDVEEGEID